MAFRWPGGKDHDDPSSAHAGDLVALVRLEGEQRSRSCLDDVSARLDSRRTLYYHQPRPFTHLVIAEFLTRREADDDRPCPVDGFKSGRPTCPLWHFNLFHIPRLHGCRF